LPQQESKGRCTVLIARAVPARAGNTGRGPVDWLGASLTFLGLQARCSH
jgi:hypothetical protein